MTVPIPVGMDYSATVSGSTLKPVVCGPLVLLAVSLMVAKVFATRRYDPNNEAVEIRKKASKGRAILRTELERRLQLAQGQSPPPPTTHVQLPPQDEHLRGP